MLRALNRIWLIGLAIGSLILGLIVVPIVWIFIGWLAGVLVAIGFIMMIVGFLSTSSRIEFTGIALVLLTIIVGVIWNATGMGTQIAKWTNPAPLYDPNNPAGDAVTDCNGIEQGQTYSIKIGESKPYLRPDGRYNVYTCDANGNLSDPLVYDAAAAHAKFPELVPAPAGVSEPTPAPTQVAPAPTAIPVSGNDWPVTGYNGAVCPRPEGMVDIISPEKDWRVMVRMGDGRLHQPCLPAEAERPAFESSFTGYCLGEPAECQMTVHTINSTLWEDTNKDGVPDTQLASLIGSKVVTIHNGGWYKIVAGEHNGGLDLVVYR